MANANTTKILRADRLFAMLVKQRDNERCRVCGESPGYENLEAHHLIKRGKFAVRYEFDNAITACKWTCHRRLENNPKENEVFARRLLGDERYDELLELSRLTKVVDFDAVIVELRELVAA